MPVETKLHPPNPRTEWLDRPGLVSSLARTGAKLVLVGAPAGFGKTTLVAQWRASGAESRPFAWVSLDDGDDDPSRLWWHVACALQRACPEIGGEGVLRALRVPEPKITAAVLPILINELAALRAPAVLVLDDYHVITERDCHEQVAFLLRHLPPTLQIVLIARAEPRLPLARLRTAGELAEIRAPELRFTASQAATVVHSVADVWLSEPDLADLRERTEGWPAGVYLAALSLRGHPSPHVFVHEFTGGNRFIGDFLAEEVLSRQPRSSPGPASSAGFARRCATPSPSRPTRRNSSRSWSGKTCSSSRWTTPGSGTDITISSRRRSMASSPRPNQACCPSCTAGQAPGTGGMGRPTRQSATRWPQATSPKPPASSPTTGSAM